MPQVTKENVVCKCCMGQKPVLTVDPFSFLGLTLTVGLCSPNCSSTPPTPSKQNTQMIALGLSSMLIYFLLLIGPVFIENGIMRGRDLKSGDILGCDYFRKYTDTQIRIGWCEKIFPLHIVSIFLICTSIL
jgi:hypothetical protein